MDLNPTSVVMLLFGIVLVYSAVKNEYPTDVVREALGKKAVKGPIYIPPGSGIGRQLTPGSDTLPPATGVPIVTV